jgi:maltooligosyltrehalose synthase
MEEIDAQMQHLLESSDAELGGLKAAFVTTREEVVYAQRVTAEAERQAAAGVKALQEHFQGCLRGLTEARLRRSSAEATDCGAVVTELENELLSIGEQLPVAEFAGQLADVRDAIEARRIQRQEAGNEASRAVEARLKSLREDLSAEAACLARLRDDAPRRFRQDIEELQAKLKEDSVERKSQHRALTEVVHRMQKSLEVSVGEIHEPTSTRLLRTPRTPVNTTPSASTPAAPHSIPGQEGARSTRTALWGGVSSETPVSSASRSGTPRRTALPAPPSMSGREW